MLDFNITVCNQGNVNAANIVVSDYLPAGYGFTFANNAGWTGTVTSYIRCSGYISSRPMCSYSNETHHLTNNRWREKLGHIMRKSLQQLIVMADLE
ncbi:MAG: DUF11 domain-containing protein [Saprospiraceae bacterium]|nr:DUF11 domain-containing protein [Saprospiraceae bacterium]